MCMHAGYSFLVYCVHAGATVSRLEQSISPFPTTFSPECTGQEPNISSCTRTSPPEDCQNVAKLLVTCFTSTSCTSTDAPPASTTNSELPSTTSVASPPHTTSSADSTDPTNTDSITLYTGNLRSNESNSVVGAVLIGGVVGILCLLVLLVVVVVVMVLIYFIVKKECGRKSHRKNANIHDKSDPVDVNEPVSYSELVDAPIEQSQREGPVYETITTNSENTANVSATDSTYLVDLRENMAYEITPVNLEDNVAYDINPVDLKENIAYETSKKITTQTNEAYLVSVARTGM